MAALEPLQVVVNRSEIVDRFSERGRPRPLAAPWVQHCEYILLAFQAKPKRVVFAQVSGSADEEVRAPENRTGTSTGTAWKPLTLKVSDIGRGRPRSEKPVIHVG